MNINQGVSFQATDTLDAFWKVVSSKHPDQTNSSVSNPNLPQKTSIKHQDNRTEHKLITCVHVLHPVLPELKVTGVSLYQLLEGKGRVSRQLMAGPRRDKQAFTPTLS